MKPYNHISKGYKISPFYFGYVQMVTIRYKAHRVWYNHFITGLRESETFFVPENEINGTLSAINESGIP